MGCRRPVATPSEERKTGVVACRVCDPQNLFAMGRPAVFLVIEDDYDYYVVRSVWTTRGAADAALHRLKAAHPDRWFKIDGEILRSPEDEPQ